MEQARCVDKKVAFSRFKGFTCILIICDRSKCPMKIDVSPLLVLWLQLKNVVQEKPC